MIHKWHSIFSKNLNEAPLHEKNGTQPRILITEMNINIIWAIIDDDRYLITMVLEALLHISWTIIHHILTENPKLVGVASTWVPDIFTSDQTPIHVESASKFPCLIAEDLTHLKRVVMCDETWMHNYIPLIKQESEGLKIRNKIQEKKVWQRKLVGKVMLIVFFNNLGPLRQRFVPPKTTINEEYYLNLEDPPMAC